MENRIDVVVKRKGKWFVGNTDFKTFKTVEEFKTLKEIKEFTGYRTLKKYLKDEEIPLSIEVILENLSTSSIYVLDAPVKKKKVKVEKKTEKKVPKEKKKITIKKKKVDAYDPEGSWEGINKKCAECKNDCKQNSKVKVVKCDEFKSK